LDHIAYISLPSDNGGIVLDVSEGGLRFHSIAPVEANGPIHLRFAMDSPERISAIGELAWKDATGKTGGLRFTQLSDDVRKRIRAWADESEASAKASVKVSAPERVSAPRIDPPSGGPAIETRFAMRGDSASALAMQPWRAGRAIEAEIAPNGKTNVAAAMDVLVAEPPPIEAEDSPSAPTAKTDLTPFLDARMAGRAMAPDVWLSGQAVPEPVATAPIAEPAVEIEFAPNDQDDSVLAEEQSNPLLYNLKPPIYSAPFYDLSMFPMKLDSNVAAEPVGVTLTVTIKSPIAAIGIAIALAFLVSIGIFVYVSATGTGELLLNWGEKMWR
jgi:hypothetical protein